MSPFRRNRAASAVADPAAQPAASGPGWHPVYPDCTIVIASDADMEDDGQVERRAYRVDYQRDDVPGASMTVYAYIVWGPSENGICYVVGYRCDQWPPGAAAPWPVWGCAHGSPVFSDVSEADTEAQDCATSLTVVPRDPAWEAALPFLDWDGTPW
jgi:hypothetical protein